VAYVLYSVRKGTEKTPSIVQLDLNTSKVPEQKHVGSVKETFKIPLLCITPNEYFKEK
jgi:hypothetical protein